MDTIKKVVEEKDNHKRITDDVPELKTILEESYQNNISRLPSKIVAELDRAKEDLKAQNYKQKTLKVNDEFNAEATLLTHNNEEVSFQHLINSRRAIIKFYRGSWCPYCNLELEYYNRLLSKEENKDVYMIAISPEKPDMATDKEAIENLHFLVLSDTDNTLANKLNIVFTLTDRIDSVYTQLGIDLDKDQGNTNHQLPIPAVYVVNSDGRVDYVDLEEDYTLRPRPEDVIQAYHNSY